MNIEALDFFKLITGFASLAILAYIFLVSGELRRLDNEELDMRNIKKENT